MHLKRHASQLLVAKRSARQRISKAKRVHYNKYQCFHSSSGLCLFVSQPILSDSPCAEPELDSIITTQLTSKRDLDKPGVFFFLLFFYDFIWLPRQWILQISGNSAIKNEDIRLYIMQLGGSRGFTLIKWVQMKMVCEQNQDLFTNSQRFSPGFWALSFISSDLPETSLCHKALSSIPPRHLTSHYIPHTHAGLLCIVTVIMIATVSQQMFLFGSLGCLLQTTGPCVSCEQLRILNQEAESAVEYMVLAESSSSTYLLYVPCHCLNHTAVSHLPS